MEYIKSKYNIFSKLKDSDDYFIVNILNKNADILNPELAEEYEIGKFTNKNEWIEKGYLVDLMEEEKKYKHAYLDFIQKREDDEIQLFLVPTYNCNFACSYCYQDGYDNTVKLIDKSTLDAFFNYIKVHFAGAKKYITVFGGEPLLAAEKVKSIISEIVIKSVQENIDLSFVTNGYNLIDYLPILKKGNIREIQVTLDGLEEIHNKRRPLKNGTGTFNEIVKGIDAILEYGIPVNLRVVIDKENINGLPLLAEFAKNKGWTNNPLFKTQLGRNYELHYCQKNQTVLYDRLSMYKEIYNIVKKNPVILEFHKPAFSISRFLFDNGELPEPLFDSCPGCKTEWAFDLTGNIYSCTATVGKSGESLGTYYPEETKKEEIINEWEERDVTTIPECRECNLQLACGGGCGSVAKNKSGKLHSPDCRPVKDLMSLGISLYFQKVKNSF